MAGVPAPKSTSPPEDAASRMSSNVSPFEKWFTMKPPGAIAEVEVGLAGIRRASATEAVVLGTNDEERPEHIEHLGEWNPRCLPVREALSEQIEAHRSDASLREDFRQCPEKSAAEERLVLRSAGRGPSSKSFFGGFAFRDSAN